MSYTTLKTNAATRENTHSRYLRVAPAADSLEREAESAAENVMSGQVNGLSWSLSRVSVNDPVQRKCSCGGSTSAEGECEECKEKKTLQRKPAAEIESSVAPAIVHGVLRSSGRPLDAGTRAFFEPRFGHDFSNVRVHSDPAAARSASAVRALAYTAGNDIVFADGQYSPSSSLGKK